MKLVMNLFSICISHMTTSITLWTSTSKISISVRKIKRNFIQFQKFIILSHYSCNALKFDEMRRWNFSHYHTVCVCRSHCWSIGAQFIRWCCFAFCFVAVRIQTYFNYYLSFWAAFFYFGHIWKKKHIFSHLFFVWFI